MFFIVCVWHLAGALPFLSHVSLEIQIIRLVAGTLPTETPCCPPEFGFDLEFIENFI